MNLQYKSKNGQFAVEFTGSSQKDLFEQIATFQEIFEQGKCGVCASDNLKFSTRKVKDAKGKTCTYYELMCVDCGARLAFGCHQEGNTLFPKRKDENGNWIGKFGWEKWDPNKKAN